MTNAEIRRALQARGYALDTAAGYDGAVRAFQRDAGLKPDGDAGRVTQAALKAPIAKPAPGALVTAARVRQLCPFARAEIVAALVDAAPALAAAGITTPGRAAHFLAQMAHETGHLGRLEENLSYTAARLVVVWPSRFPTVAAAKPYAANPRALANKVYGGRLGNRLPDDGWTFRGSGGFCTTGRDNYRQVGHEATPEALREPGPAIASALTYWTARGCNALADRDDVEALSRRINGGTIGLPERQALTASAKRIFGA
jgi:putative chitinase